MEKFKTLFRQTFFNPNFLYNTFGAFGVLFLASIVPNQKTTEKKLFTTVSSASSGSNC